MPMEAAGSPDDGIGHPTAAASGGHRGPILASAGHGHDVVDCAVCGFAHLSPRPTAAELAAYYTRSFYETHSPPDWAEKEAAEQAYWSIEHADRLSAFAELLGRPTG